MLERIYELEMLAEELLDEWMTEDCPLYDRHGIRIQGANA